MRTVSASLTDLGKRRTNNEDSFLTNDAMHLYVVADGVGGCASGEVASAETVAMVQSWARDRQELLKGYGHQPTESRALRIYRMLENAVQYACYMVFGMGTLNPEQKGMATTLSALLLVEGTGFIAQVGDSRVYLSRRGKVTQLTEDHTLVNYRLKHGLITPEEAARANRNIITRAVGTEDFVHVDVFDLRVAAGDRFLLCSDGLHDYLRDGELDALMAGNLAVVPQRLVDLANQRGGKDNITVVGVDVL